jgi:hypothetical protein
MVDGNDYENITNQCNCPTGLLYNRQGNPFVAEWSNNHIHQYQLEIN